jgi:catalase
MSLFGDSDTEFLAGVKRGLGLDAMLPPDAAKRAPDFLSTELTLRLKRSPVTFHLKVQVTGSGDPSRDPTKAWPDTRGIVDLGVITLTRVVPDSDEVEKKLLFMPTALTDGIEASDDPLIELRGGAYAVWFSRRNP